MRNRFFFKPRFLLHKTKKNLQSCVSHVWSACFVLNHGSPRFVTFCLKSYACILTGQLLVWISGTHSREERSGSRSQSGVCWRSEMRTRSSRHRQQGTKRREKRDGGSLPGVKKACSSCDLTYLHSDALLGEEGLQLLWFNVPPQWCIAWWRRPAARVI